MSTSSLVKVCGDDLVMTSFSLSVVPASMNLSEKASRTETGASLQQSR